MRCDRRVYLFLPFILLLTLALRVPSFFEPLWYDDESISLAAAQAIRRGQLLYKDIYDNKPPLFYLLLAVRPSLLWAKSLATAFVLSTQVFIFALARCWFSGKEALAAALVFGVLSNTPLFEGNILNGEILMIFPLVVGIWLGFSAPSEGSFLRWFLAGLFFGLATLIKIPSIFDFLAFLIFVAFFWKREQAGRSFGKLLLLGGGLGLPWFLAFLYFAIRRGLSDFLFSVFLYNLRYVGVGEGLFSSEIKFIVLGLLLSVPFWLWRFRQQISFPTSFLVLWFCFSLSGALISGRPYSHYLIQVLPSLAFLIVHSILEVRFWERWLSSALCFLFFSLYLFLPFYRYPVYSYYGNFVAYILGNRSENAYREFFDPRVERNIKIANFVKGVTEERDEILVWGDDPAIYVLSGRKPATKYVTHYHLAAAGCERGLGDILVRRLPSLIVVTGEEAGLSRELLSRYSLVRKLAGAQIFAAKGVNL